MTHRARRSAHRSDRSAHRAASAPPPSRRAPARAWLAAILAAACALAPGAAPAAADAGGEVRLRAATLRPGSLPRDAAPSADGLWIVRFDRAPGRAEREALAGAGAEVLGYLPDDAYLVRLAPGGEAALDGVAGMDWRTPLRPEWKLAPELARKAGGAILDLELILAPGAPLADLVARARDLGASPRRTGGPPDRPRLWLQAAPGLLPALAGLPHLIWLERVPPITGRNDDIKWICQSGVPVETPVWDRGIHGEAEVLGHVDSRFDWGSCWFADPEGDPIGPDHRKIVFKGDAAPVPGASLTHGTHTAGTLVGNGYQAGAGADTTLRALAYRARLASSNYQQGDYDLYADLALHHAAGARIHSNSWGQDGQTAYTALCQIIDAYSHDVEEDLVVFACTNLPTLQSPENAKNVLAVGASLAGPYFNEHYSGGEGPTIDGRRKPEIYAPGYMINSAYADQPCNQISKSGCSMACPAVVSAGALARQYFREGWYPTGAPVPSDALVPSGALLRAVLLNATLPMDSLPDGYPNDLEGWGRLVLDESLHFAGDARGLWVHDVRNAQGLETGEWVTYVLPVEAGDEVLEITLAFTDPPGEVAAAEPVVNDLDLRVLAPGGASYLGNVFDTAAGVSQTGGAADPVNMVERVIVADPEAGDWQVIVEASAAPLGPQGYALAAAGDLGDVVSDQTPPALELAWEHAGAAGDSLLFTVTADEPLAPAPFTLAVGGEDLAVRPADGDGLIWEADYGLPEQADSLAVGLRVRDLGGNVAELASALAVRRVDAGATARLDSPDGRFTLELAGGALDEAAHLVAGALPETGRRVREGEILSAYRVGPFRDLDAERPSLVTLRYDPDALPPGAAADRLVVLAGEAGDTLASYHDGGSPPAVSANPLSLEEFRLVVGPAGSSASADAAFLALEPGYPNPFRAEGGSTVAFSLRSSQRVDLAVYDVAGRLVARLVDGERLLPGDHRRTWDGRDEAGEPAASGVYFARLETGGGSAATIRLVLLR